MFTCCPSMPSSCWLGHNFCRTLGYDILVVVSSSASDFGSPIVTRSAIVESCGMESHPSSRASISIVGNPNQKFGCGVSWNKETASFCFDFFSPLSFEFMLPEVFPMLLPPSSRLLLFLSLDLLLVCFMLSWRISMSISATSS